MSRHVESVLETVAQTLDPTNKRRFLVKDNCPGDVEVTATCIIIHPEHFRASKDVLSLVKHCLTLGRDFDKLRERARRLQIEDSTLNLRVSIRALLAMGELDTLTSILAEELGVH